jgi:hypothetical protein
MGVEMSTQAEDLQAFIAYILILFGLMVPRLWMAALGGAIGGAWLPAQSFGSIIAGILFASVAYGLKRAIQMMFRRRGAASNQTETEDDTRRRPDRQYWSTAPPVGEVIDWDISPAARQLNSVQTAENCLFLFGIWLLALGGKQVFSMEETRAFFVMFLLIPLALGMAIIFKQAGTLHYFALKRLFWLFPFTSIPFLIAAAFGGFALAEWFHDLMDVETFEVVWSFLVPGAIGLLSVVLSFWWMCRLSRAPLGATGYRIADILRDMDRIRAAVRPRKKLGKPVSRVRGIAFGVAAVVLLLIPLSPRLGAVVPIVQFFLIMRARGYFQVSVGSLLAEDIRSPILLLRSFGDDEKVGVFHANFTEMRWINPPVEERLAQMFKDFGPFIAIGSPQEKVPQVGAARARLSDADWQAVVLNWMNTSSSIVMLAGTTQWVEWELSHVIETGNATKLMLLFPLTKGGRKGRDDHLARVNLGKSAFAGSNWARAWERIANPEGVLAARFHASGAMTVIRAGRMTPTAIQLAALILHHTRLMEAAAAAANHPGTALARVAAGG